MVEAITGSSSTNGATNVRPGSRQERQRTAPGLPEAIRFQLCGHGWPVQYSMVVLLGLGRRDVSDRLQQPSMMEPNPIIALTGGRREPIHAFIYGICQLRPGKTSARLAQDRIRLPELPALALKRLQLLSNISGNAGPFAAVDLGGNRLACSPARGVIALAIPRYVPSLRD